jgi:asparagine synthase (glutamine-hydrolysing)
MCGIAGVLQLDGTLERNDTAPVLSRMGAQMSRRGPDGEATYVDDYLGLIFTRLSIVDLAGGMQPFHSEDDNIILAANGEIFNHQDLRKPLESRHQFRSHCDCEVLLHLYEEKGLDFLDQVNGMYGCVVWDKRKRRLVLGRDRLGIKPLFYCVLKDTLIFGSEMKAIFAHPETPKAVNWQEVSRFCQGMVRDEIPSFFQGISPLPAGNFLVVECDAKTLEQKTYWKIQRPSNEEYTADHRSTEHIIEEYRNLLVDAVHLNLMSDVEVGLFLSGGIDSSSIAALSSRQLSLPTFTVLSQSTLTNEDAKFGHLAAQECQLENYQVLCHWVDARFHGDQWKELLWVTETPFCEAEHLYKYNLHRFAKAHRPNLKVMLLGQGSDEFNGGYSTSWTLWGKKSENWPEFMTLLRALERQLFAGQELGFIDNGLGHPPLFRTDYLAAVKGLKPAPDIWYSNARRNAKTLQTYNLWHEDRTAAGCGIESRVPFLDHRLVEFCMHVPHHKRAELFWDKHILREAMAPYLPVEFRRRRKVPFYHGADTRSTYRMLFNILLSHDRALIREAFGDGRDEHPVFSREAIHQAVSRVAENPEYTGMPLLLTIVNAALLEKMAQNIETTVTSRSQFELLPAREIRNWAAEEEELQREFGLRRTEVSLDSTLVFSENTYLVKEDTYAKEQGSIYVVVDDKVTYQLDDEEIQPWVEVLRRIDGKKTLQTLLAEAQVSEGVIRKYLEEAMDYNVIKVL